MNINSKYKISKTRGTNEIISNILSGTLETYEPVNTDYRHVKRILSICRQHTDAETKNASLIRIYKMLGMNDTQIAERLFDTVGDTVVDTSKDIDSTVEEDTTSSSKYSKDEKKRALENLIKFFSEFRFTPSHRFVNTLARVSNPKEYVMNYFMIQDHSYATDIADKITSPEFTEICNILHNETVSPINSRFKVYFGEPGTGKTTKAQEVADYTIICASDMLPTDLMQNFAFSDGKAEFQKSDLWLAMVEGKKIVLDEMNMLPFESLRWLQGILDGKKTFSYKGFEIEIADGFEVIGTMNLNVNGQVIAMPAPLVDRCISIEEFKLTANELLSSVI